MIRNNQIFEHFWYQRSYFYLCINLMVALVIRLVDLPNRWLWFDELQSVTYSSLPIDLLLKCVRVFDAHPPLYYIQLHFWMLIGTSDWWIKFNSVTWSMLTLIVIFFLTRDLFNSNLALVATSIFSVLPFAVFYAQEARMYSWLMFLGISSIFFIIKFIKNQNWLYLASALLFTESFLYSHGSSFLLLVSLGSYVIWILVESRFQKWQVALRIGLVLIVATILYFPWLHSAISISLGHLLKPNIEDVIHTLFVVVYGFGYRAITYPLWFEWIAIILTMIGVCVVIMCNSQGRGIVLAFIVIPIVFCILVSYLYSPIWLYRTLAYTAPFWSIVIAVLTFQLIPNWLKKRTSSLWMAFGLLFIIICVLVFSTSLQQTFFSYPWHIRDATQFLQSVTQSGDVVYIANERVFWGIAWYFVGPGSVNPLTTNYVLVSPTNVILLAKPAFPSSGGNVEGYLVYRSMDDITPFVVKLNAPNWDFDKMKVVLLNK